MLTPRIGALAPASPARLSRVLASIDQGSSSTKLLVLGFDSAGHSTVLADRKIGTSLGKGVANGEPLPRANQDRTFAALKTLIADAKKHGVNASEIPLVATAVVRSSPDGAAFMEQAKALGLTRARVLSGPQEAQMGYAGAVASIAQDKMKLATLDLGGGSFQLAIGTGHTLERGGSTQIGSNYIIANLLPAKALSAADFAKADAALDVAGPMPLAAGLL